MAPFNCSSTTVVFRNIPNWFTGSRHIGEGLGVEELNEGKTYREKEGEDRLEHFWKRLCLQVFTWISQLLSHMQQIVQVFIESIGEDHQHLKGKVYMLGWFNESDLGEHHLTSPLGTAMSVFLWVIILVKAEIFWQIMD